MLPRPPFPELTATRIRMRPHRRAAADGRPTLAWGVVLVTVAAMARGQQCLASEGPGPKLLGYTVVAEYPHDMHSFTQGLQHDRDCSSGKCVDIFWESAGLYGQSSVRKVVLSTGEVKQKETLPQQWFAEGLTRLGDHLYQLTWQTGIIFKWAIKDGVISRVGELKGPLNDGWGLTTDGKHLIATDSTAVVSFIDPETMQVVRRLTVKDGDREVKWLNELEMIEGQLWANVWQTECIAHIDIESGQVTHWLLLHGLRHGLHQRHPEHHEMDVLNGIAYDAETKRLFITGKKWPRIFEVTIGHQQAHTNFSLDEVRHHCLR